MKQGDKFVLYGLIVLVFILLIEYGFFQRRSDKVVVIRSDGKIVKELQIEKNVFFEVKSKEGHLFVEIRNGKVKVINSTCKDKLCEKEGWISNVGESIICLPNRISVSIIGKNGEKIDTVTY